MIKVGEQLPSAKLFKLGEKGVDTIDSTEYLADKKVAIVSVPSAFSSTCSIQLPGYIEKSEEILSKGMDEIVCLAVNNAFVMKAWEKHLEASDKVTFLSDGNGEFSKAMGLLADASMIGFGEISARYAAVANNNVLEAVFVEAGTALEVSTAENLLNNL